MEIAITSIMVISTIIVFLLILKKIMYVKVYYKSQNEAIISMMKHFQEEFKGKENFTTFETQINFKKNDIITDIISFNSMIKKIDYTNKSQDVYLSKLKQLMYINLFAFLFSFDEKYKSKKYKKLYKRKNFKLMSEEIEMNILDPISAQYEVYQDVKNIKNNINKKTILLMQLIERKETKQKDKIKSVFKEKGLI